MISQFLEKLFGKSWLTSLLGLLGGMATVLVPILQGNRMPTQTEWVMAIAIAVLGLASKAFNVTGKP